MGGSGCPVLMFLAWCLEDAKCQMGLACSSWFSWGCFAVCLLVLLGVLTLLLPGDTPQVRTSQSVFRDPLLQSNPWDQIANQHHLSWRVVKAKRVVGSRRRPGRDGHCLSITKRWAPILIGSWIQAGRFLSPSWAMGREMRFRTRGGQMIIPT